MFAGKAGPPTTVILDGRTMQSTPASGGRGGYAGSKCRKGSKVHIAVDTLEDGNQNQFAPIKAGRPSEPGPMRWPQSSFPHDEAN